MQTFVSFGDDNGSTKRRRAARHKRDPAKSQKLTRWRGCIEIWRITYTMTMFIILQRCFNADWRVAVVGSDQFVCGPYVRTICFYTIYPPLADSTLLHMMNKTQQTIVNVFNSSIDVACESAPWTMFIPVQNQIATTDDAPSTTDLHLREIPAVFEFYGSLTVITLLLGRAIISMLDPTISMLRLNHVARAAGVCQLLITFIPPMMSMQYGCSRWIEREVAPYIKPAPSPSSSISFYVYVWLGALYAVSEIIQWPRCPKRFPLLHTPSPSPLSSFTLDPHHRAAFHKVDTR